MVTIPIWLWALLWLLAGSGVTFLASIIADIVKYRRMMK